MSRSMERRIKDVRRLVEAARSVYGDRARFAPELVKRTGLSPEGVELGFASLEQSANETELRALVSAAGHAETVHVILSANVFVSPLRALAIARAAAERVTVRPSVRDPVLAHALIETARDDGIAVTSERAPACVAAQQIHVYGREATIADVRSRARAGAVVRGHGPGMGVAVVTRAARLGDAAEAVAADVVPFDQRGCLSPRVVVIEGDDAHARAFAQALHERLVEWGVRVPRGVLSSDERVDAARWREAMAFAGSLWQGTDHAVALTPALAVPPAGRHVQIVQEPVLPRASVRLAAVDRFVVAVGSDDPDRAAAIAPAHARLSLLGRMQRPPLDGPVDRRTGSPFQGAASSIPLSCDGL